MPKIIFEARTPVTQAFPQPEPASKAIPQWWKDLPHYLWGKNEFSMQAYLKDKRSEHPTGTGVPNVGIKRCLPVLDGLTAGYIIKSHCDIEFAYREGIDRSVAQEPFFSSSIWPVSRWSKDQFSGYDIPEGYSDQVYKWSGNWIIKTPPGYSTLFVHPVGYNSLPFKTLTGIVDTDKLETDVNPPFIIKKDFQGIIEAETPIVQIIPFKREEWEMEITEVSELDQRIRMERLVKKIVSSYGRHFRAPKSYK